MKFLFLLSFITQCYCYINTNQWKMIDNSIRYYKRLESKDYLEPIYNFIYKNHHKWTIKFTNNFIEKNNFYLKQSQQNELYIYASKGLLKAINNYDGYGNFYSYSKIYMNGELYKGISDVGPIRLLPHHYRVSKKWRNKNKEHYEKYNKPIDRRVNWHSSCISNINVDTKSDILSVVNDLNCDERLLFSLRYDEKMDKKYTLKQISDFYGCSQETVRNRMKSIHDKIKEILTGLL